MKNIHYVIGIPGSGKSYWLAFKESPKNIIFDDISQIENPLILLENAVKNPEIKNIYISDVNFMETKTLQKAEEIIKKFMGNNNYQEFYVVFKSTKEISNNNVLLRSDKRNVDATIKRFVNNYESVISFLELRQNNVEIIITNKYKKRLSKSNN